MDELTNSWSRYWHADSAASRQESFSGFFGVHSKEFWRAQLALCSTSATIVDFGCGSGALLLYLAGAVNGGKRRQFFGIDRAELSQPDLSPIEHDCFRQFRLFGNTNFDATPIKNGAAELVISQYGVEYGLSAKLWQELDRITGHGSRVAFVMHKRGSRMFRVATDEQALLCKILSPDGVISAAEAMLPLLAVVQRSRRQGQAASARIIADAQKARSLYNSAVASLIEFAASREFRDVATEAMDALARILQRSGFQPIDRLGSELQRLRQLLDDQSSRLDALLACALAPGDVEQVGCRLVEVGFQTPVVGVLQERGYDMGWTLTAHKSSKSS